MTSLRATGGPHGIDAEWLIDNFHIIKDSLREVRRGFAAGIRRTVAQAGGAAARGLSSRLRAALELVAHTDSELDETRIAGFVRAFQEAAPLMIGELWALPTMLRLVLLENLRRLSELMIWRREERRRAEALGETRNRWRRIGNSRYRGQRAEPGATPTHGSERSIRRTPDPTAADQGSERSRPSSTSKTSWNSVALIPMRCCGESRGIRPRIRSLLAIACSSLRLLSAVDWNAFFEQTSHVEAILREDPAGIYQRQDFATSDRYRRAVEMIARIERRRDRGGPPGR